MLYIWAPLGKKKQLPGLNSWKKNNSCSYNTKKNKSYKVIPSINQINPSTTIFVLCILLCDQSLTNYRRHNTVSLMIIDVSGRFQCCDMSVVNVTECILLQSHQLMNSMSCVMTITIITEHNTELDTLLQWVVSTVNHASVSCTYSTLSLSPCLLWIRILYSIAIPCLFLCLIKFSMHCIVL